MGSQESQTKLIQKKSRTKLPDRLHWLERLGFSISLPSHMVCVIKVNVNVKSYMNYLLQHIDIYIFLTVVCTYFNLTEPSRVLQRKSTQGFPRIGLFVVSLGCCRRPIEFLTSSHPCGRLSKIPIFQIHKVEKWKKLSPFRQRVFFVIFHEDNFFEVIWLEKNF